MVKTILVGHGYFGRIYRDHLDQHKNFEVVGVCDTDYERLRILDSRTTAPTYDMMRDSVEHDAVVICTPPSEHADLTIKALTAGKHVLCMKPGAMSMTEASLICDTAEEAGVAYMVDYTAMNAPEYRDIIPSIWGSISSISSSRHVPTGPKPEGIILDLLSHDIAMFDDVFWNFDTISVSCQILDPVTAALTISGSDDERMMYANASYNATYPKKDVLLRIKPREGVTNPLIATTWNQNQRFVKIETQGRSIELHYRHDPDPITLRLDDFYDAAISNFSNAYIFHSIWRVLHAALHSADNDGMLVKVEKP